MRRSIPAQYRNESVDCYLGLVEQREPVCDDLQKALVCSVRDTNVKVANCNVDGDAATSFSADTGTCTFQGKSTATQHSHNLARCSVVAKDVEGTATPAGTRGGRKGEPQTAKEQDTEHQGVELAVKSCRTTGERKARKRTTLRSEQSLRSVKKSGPHGGGHEEVVNVLHCLELLLMLGHARPSVVQRVHLRADSISQRFPTWGVEPNIVEAIPGSDNTFKVVSWLV